MQSPSDENKRIRGLIQKETAASNAPLAEQRKSWIDYAKDLPLHPGVVLREEVIENVPCLWLSRSESPKQSTIVYLHGGGYVDGAILTHREFVSRLVGTTGHRALMIEYRLAPEYRISQAIDDVVRVYVALTSSRRLDPGQTAFGGDSSGGGMVVSALAHLDRNGKTMPACGFSVSGVFDMTLSGETMASRDEIDPCLSYAALKGWTRYFDAEDLSAGDISPLFDDAQGLPPMLLLAGDHEVWLDDSIRMAERIKAGGGKAELRVWDAMWHVWPMYADLPEAQQAIEEIGRFIESIQ